MGSCGQVGATAAICSGNPEISLEKYSGRGAGGEAGARGEAGLNEQICRLIQKAGMRLTGCSS